MIGKTNSQTGGAIKGEKLNLSLKTNQASGNDLLGVVITVTHAGGATNYVWEGYEMTVDIPPYLEYTLTFSGVEGYKAPVLGAFTAVPDNSRSVVAEYKAEKAIVTLVADDAASMSGTNVNINGKDFTFNGQAVEMLIPFGTEYTITPSAKDYYATPSSVTRTASEATYSQTLTYKASKLTLDIASNQSNDTTISAVKATVSWSGTSQEVASGSTIRIPSDKEVAIIFPSVEGYKTPDPIKFTNASGTVSKSGTYQTTVITANIGSNQTDKTDVADATVTIGEKVLKNGENAKFATGSVLTATFSSVTGYATPSSQSITASGTAMTVTGTYNSTFVTVVMADNQSSLNDIASATATVAASGITTQTVSDGGVVKVPTGVSCTVTWNAVTDYKTPSAQTFTASGAAVTKTGTYQTEVVSVTLNADDGSSVNGAVVTINGVSHTWSGTAIAQKVAFDKIYDIVPQALDGFATPASQTDITASQASRPVTLTYTASALKVSIKSNQNSDSTIAAVKATVAYGSTSVQVGNEETVSLPANVDVTITFPEVEGYLAPEPISFTHAGGEVTKSGTYQTQLLTVNVTGSGAIPSGYTITGKNSSTSATLFTQTTSSATHKIPWGTTYIVTPSSLDGYDAIYSQSGTANSLSNTLTFTYVYNPAKDLSMYDVHGNPIQRSTANCYVVKEAGTYMFPLVYGNAIKNGEVNTAAFTNNGGTYSHDFVGAYGKVITSPYIEENHVNDVASVILSNTDTDEVFTDIGIVNRTQCKYIQFSVANVPSTGANGMISVRNGENTVLWSWHIWIWPHDLSPVEITNSTGVTYNIMPVNLASKYDSDGVHIKNWFYQWGRMTPLLCPSAYNSGADHSPGSITKTSKASYLYEGVENPNTFYYNKSSPYNWFGSKSYYNLWDAACTDIGNSDNDTVKTVYDPCPVGWKIPNGNTFTGFYSNDPIGDFSNGYYFARYSGDTTGVFIPASGCREYSSGTISIDGYTGTIWTSASVDNYACNLYMDGVTGDISDVYMEGTPKAFGHSIRPVEDDITDIDEL